MESDFSGKNYLKKRVVNHRFFFDFDYDQEYDDINYYQNSRSNHLPNNFQSSNNLNPCIKIYFLTLQIVLAYSQSIANFQAQMNPLILSNPNFANCSQIITSFFKTQIDIIAAS